MQKFLEKYHLKLPHAGMIQIRSKGFRNFSAFLSQPKLLDTPSFIFFDKYTKVYREVKGKTKNNNKVLYGVGM